MNAARLTDPHICPMTSPNPHVGGVVLAPGSPTVMIGGLPAACMGDVCTCPGPPNSIITGSQTVFIAGRNAARVGDATAHGGTIAVGCPTVMIGG